MRLKTLACLCLLQISCAALTGSATDALRVTASPRSAQVRIDDEMVGSAPTTVQVPKRRQSSVEVSAPGYQTAACSTRMSASGGYVAADIALCVLLFPIGCISFVDAAGAWNELESAHCHVTLAPEPKAE